MNLNYSYCVTYKKKLLILFYLQRKFRIHIAFLFHLTNYQDTI